MVRELSRSGSAPGTVGSGSVPHDPGRSCRAPPGLVAGSRRARCYRTTATGAGTKLA